MLGSKVPNTRFSFSTKGAVASIDVTDHVQEAVAKSGVRNGFAHVFDPHPTGILILTDDDHGLLEDMRAFLEKAILKRENCRQLSNAFAYLGSMLLSTYKTIPVIDGHAEFGTGQSLSLWRQVFTREGKQSSCK